MVTLTRAHRVSDAFVKLAEALVGDYDVVDLLQSLVESSVDLLDAAAAGLVLADPDGGLQVLASTSEESQLVEPLQQQTGAGPCIECYETGIVVTVEDIGLTSDRWPQFAAAAVSQGFRSVHAIPMRLHGSTLGAMNLFRTGTGTLGAEDTGPWPGACGCCDHRNPAGKVHPRKRHSQ